MSTIQTTNPTYTTFDAWREACLTIIDAAKDRLRENPEFMKWASEQPEPWTFDDCLNKAVTSDLPDLPAAPMPAWAEDYEISADGFDEIMATYSSRPIESGPITAHVEQSMWFHLRTGETGVNPTRVALDAAPYLIEEMDINTAPHVATALTRALQIAGEMN